MELRFYADATALIGLARIGRLDLLALLPTPTHVTVQVWNEVTADPRPKPSIRAATGIMGLLLLGKQQGHIPAAPPLLDELVRQRFDGREDRQSLQEERVDDLLAIVTSFSGKLYGLRSHKKARELVSAVKAVVAGAGDLPDENPG